MEATNLGGCDAGPEALEVFSIYLSIYLYRKVMRYRAYVSESVPVVYDLQLGARLLYDWAGDNNFCYNENFASFPSEIQIVTKWFSACMNYQVGRREFMLLCNTKIHFRVYYLTP